LFEESFTPQADDLTSGVEPGGDLVVRQALSSEKDHLGSHHLKIRQRISGRTPAQFMFLARR
jgi:hypothetical protein